MYFQNYFLNAIININLLNFFIEAYYRLFQILNVLLKFIYLYYEECVK